MKKNELTFDVVETLKEVMEVFLPELVQRAKETIGPSDLIVFNSVLEQFYSGEKTRGRWYDKYHIPLAVLFAGKAVKLGQAPPETVPAVSLHDIGYAFLDPDLKEKGESKENLQIVSLSRIRHVQEAAGPAAKILASYGFSPDEICNIVDVVVHHDNGYLGWPIKEESLLLSARDADRTLVVHFISFYKDWISIASQREDFTPLDLFRSRSISFYGASDPAPVIWGKPETLTKEDEFHTHRIPYTPLAKEWRNKQFEARWQEIQSDILRDKDYFRQYAEKHIRAELEAGRG
jgi:hypothetical protein